MTTTGRQGREVVGGRGDRSEVRLTDVFGIERGRESGWKRRGGGLRKWERDRVYRRVPK